MTTQKKSCLFCNSLSSASQPGLRRAPPFSSRALYKSTAAVMDTADGIISTHIYDNMRNM